MSEPEAEITVRLSHPDALWLRAKCLASNEPRLCRIQAAIDRGLWGPTATGNGTGLDGPGQARRNDVGTAKAAAATLGKPGNKRRAVLRAIIDAGSAGLTAEEAVGRTGIEYRTLTPRVGELKRGGYVEALDGVTRPGTHRVEQQVLVATPLGRREMGVTTPEGKELYFNGELIPSGGPVER